MSDAGPLTRVLEAVEAGAGDRERIVASTGLTRDVVDASLEHLVRIGRLTSESLSLGCPPSGCGGCGAPTGHGCAAPVSAGPTLVALTVRRPTT